MSATTICENHTTNLHCVFTVCVNGKKEQEAADFSAGRLAAYPHVTSLAECMAIYSTTTPKHIHASPEVAKTIDDEWLLGCNTCNNPVRPFGTEHGRQL